MTESLGRWSRLAVLAGAGLTAVTAVAQVPGTPGSVPQSKGSPAKSPPAASPPAVSPDAPAAEVPAERHGQVLFQSRGAPPEPVDEPHAGTLLTPNVPVSPENSLRPPPRQPDQTTIPDLSDREREAFHITRYDLDLQLQPTEAGVTMHARISVRNGGAAALNLVPLQISSSLHWDAAALLDSTGGAKPLKLAQHRIDTDADHTGQANEAIVTLDAPLAPGASVTFDVVYSGKLPTSTGRLQRIGVPASQAASVDWDEVGTGPRATALRGFGNVLWYPVVSPQLFLGSGNELFRAIGARRWRNRVTTAQLRVTLHYVGEPPAGVFFCGQRQPFRVAEKALAASGAGFANAQFSEAPIGFRTLSLFVIERPEVPVAPLPTGGASAPALAAFSSSVPGTAASPVAADSVSSVSASSAADSSSERLLQVEASNEAALPDLAAATEHVAPLLMQWFGPRPLSPLTVLDARGQPFQDGTLLRAPLASLSGPGAAGTLAHSLTAAWVQTGQPWMDEGLGEFMGLLWTEGIQGRPAALAQLAEMMTPVALSEPTFPRPAALGPPGEPATPASADTDGAEAATPSTAPSQKVPREAPGLSPAPAAGEALIDAQSELYYRRKAAAVWWMLRDITGDDALRQALGAWCRRPVGPPRDSRADAAAFQALLERTSGKDLGWFFDDWVMRDRGLPDLTLADVTPRQLPAGPGHNSGWLVAVTVRNDGAAAAEVPLVVRSGSFSNTKRLRVPAFAAVTERVLVEAPPTEVVLNDGSVPEVRASTHRREIVLHTQ